MNLYERALHEAGKRFIGENPDIQDLAAMQADNEARGVRITELEAVQPVVETLKVYPEISLEEEFERQVSIIFEKVAKPLGISEEDCLKALPKRFPDRLPEYEELGIDTPLLVPKFPGFSWLQVVEAVGIKRAWHLISLTSQGAEVNYWYDPRGIHFPDRPYAGWFHVSKRYQDKALHNDIRSELHPVEVGANHWDGLGLVVARPDLVGEKDGFYFHGGQLISNEVPEHWGRPNYSVPHVSLYDNEPMFNTGDERYPIGNNFAPVCGRIVETNLGRFDLLAA